jgi:hypothetical protein
MKRQYFIQCHGIYKTAYVLHVSRFQRNLYDVTLYEIFVQMTRKSPHSYVLIVTKIMYNHWYVITKQEHSVP